MNLHVALQPLAVASGSVALTRESVILTLEYITRSGAEHEQHLASAAAVVYHEPRVGIGTVIQRVVLQSTAYAAAGEHGTTAGNDTSGPLARELALSAATVSVELVGGAGNVYLPFVKRLIESSRWPDDRYASMSHCKASGLSMRQRGN